MAKGDILRHGDALMLQVIHHSIVAIISVVIMPVMPRLCSVPNTWSRFSSASVPEQVSLDLHQVFIRKYHMVLLVKQLACLQHQPIGVRGFSLGVITRNVAVPQRDHMPQRRYHRPR